MKFQEVIGQTEVKDQLVKMVKQNRLSHALLFLGKEGSGALSLALAFSQFVVCQAYGDPKSVSKSSAFFEEPGILENIVPPKDILTDSCGICPACTKARQLIHPDIHYSYPVITKKQGEKPLSSDFITEWRQFVKGNAYGNVYDWLQYIGAENKQGNISADECNNIIKKLSLKAFESKFKILIVWMPEFLGKEGNKLLKLIEEPPPDTLFIFVAESENDILATILSRTQLIKIPSLTNAEIENALIERSNQQDNKAEQIASVAEGNYREALLLLQNAEEDWQHLLREWLNAILKNGPVAQIKWIEEMNKLGREKQKQFIRYFIHLLEQALRFRVVDISHFSLDSSNRSSNINIPEKERDFAIRLNKLCSLGAQKAIITELDKAMYYIERNANGKMLFHALSIRLHYIITDNSLILIN